MRNGQILEGPDAIKAAEADKFPSYANHDEGKARYGQMHDLWTRTRRPTSRSAQARATR